MSMAALVSSWHQQLGISPGEFSSQTLAPVNFPFSPLTCLVEIAVGADLTADPSTWIWTDITSSVRHAQGVSVTIGRPDESSRVNPSSASLTLDNVDGRFCRRNPTSPYYGRLSRSTPVRLSVDPGPGMVTRFTGFVAEWPARWDITGVDATVPVVASGILRRLGQAGTLKSPLYRAISASTPIIAYWPCEDESSSTSAAATSASVRPLSVTGSVAFADGGPAGSSPLPNFSGGGQLSGRVPSTTQTPWAVGIAFRAGENGTSVPLEFTSTRGLKFDLQVAVTSSGTTITVIMTDGAGTQTSNSTDLMPDWLVDTDHFVRLGLIQTGSDVELFIGVDGVEAADFTPAYVGVTLGYPRDVRLGPINPFAGTHTSRAFHAGHLVVWGPLTQDYVYGGTAGGYAGETATDRIVRLCGEEGVPLIVTSASAVRLGVQPTTGFVDILREAEAADGGILYERGFGLGYQALAERYNRTPALSLDVDADHVASEPEPADDDQRLRNSWTVSRTGGSSASAQDNTSIAEDGLYADSVTLALYSDASLPSQAGWRIHLGTIDEDRWPSVSMRMHGTPDLIEAWSSLPYGARITIEHPPSQTAPDPVDAVIEGWTERWDTTSWDITLNTSPASVYDVQQVASAQGNRGRVDAAASYLVADAASADTSLSVASDGAIWRTGSTSFDLSVGGERMTVTSISGSSSPQTFTVVRSINAVVKAQTSGTRVSLWRPSVWAL